MTADDLTVRDMLNDMSDAEWKEFAHVHRAQIRQAIINGHDTAFGPDDWGDELAEYQQRVRDGEADAKQQERDYRRSKGVHDGR